MSVSIQTLHGGGQLADCRRQARSSSIKKTPLCGSCFARAVFFSFIFQSVHQRPRIFVLGFIVWAKRVIVLPQISVCTRTAFLLSSLLLFSLRAVGLRQLRVFDLELAETLLLLSKLNLMYCTLGIVIFIYNHSERPSDSAYTRHTVM